MHANAQNKPQYATVTSDVLGPCYLCHQSHSHQHDYPIITSQKQGFRPVALDPGTNDTKWMGQVRVA